jgi:hypothetical protein
MCRWRTYESNKKHPLQQEIGWTIHHCKLVPKFISLVAANSCWRAPPPVFCYVLWLFNSVQPLTTDVTIGPFSEYNGILGPWMVGAQCSLAFPRILKISDFILYTYIYVCIWVWDGISQELGTPKWSKSLYPGIVGFYIVSICGCSHRIYVFFFQMLTLTNMLTNMLSI